MEDYMSNFNTAFAKNFTKLAFITVGALSSTLGLHTELTIIFGDVQAATWLTIAWILIVLAAVAHYKANHDVELEVFREFERNRHMLGQAPIGTNNSIYSANKIKQADEMKIGDPVFLQENK
jgi:hypothetical protein